MKNRNNIVLNITMLIVALCFVISCGCENIGGAQKQKNNLSGFANNIKSSDNVKYARLFRINKESDYTSVEVVNPWDTTRLLQRYILVSKDKNMPKDFPQGKVVRTPVDRSIAYTAVDIGSLEALSLLDKVYGVCEARYILSPSVRESLNNGKIKDLGSYTKPNIEQMMAVGAQLIFASPYAGQDYGLVENIGSVIAECAGYMETTPLGRCEWIKFYALFFEKYDLADSIFKEIEEKYLQTEQLINQKVNRRPKLVADKRYGQVWFMSPGNSYTGEFYRAAGANYPWAEVISPTALSLSFETVLSKAVDADVWLFGYVKSDGDLTLSDLKSEYSSYSLIKAFKTGNVYGCNTEKVPFYEKAPLRPDLVLLDIAKMLHGDLFKEHTFTFYKKLNEK